MAWEGTPPFRGVPAALLTTFMVGKGRERHQPQQVPGLGLQPRALPPLLTAPRLYCLSSCLENKHRRFRNCLKIETPIPAKHLQR